MWCLDIKLVFRGGLLAVWVPTAEGEHCEPDPRSWNPFTAQGGFTQGLPKTPEPSPPQLPSPGALVLTGLKC